MALRRGQFPRLRPRRRGGRVGYRLPEAPVSELPDATEVTKARRQISNSTFGHGLLPGSSLGHADLAVVRCANGERVPQPTHRGHGGSARRHPYQPPLPRGTLYEHDYEGTYSWLLAQTSRTYRSSQVGARAAASYTRWTLPENRTSLMGKDWHGLTAI